MLFQYTYPENHSLENLNSYLLEFINNLSRVNNGTPFRVENYFHQDFAAVLNISPVLKDKFEKFFNSFKPLSQNLKDEFIAIMNRAQNIATFFEKLDECCLDLKTTRLNNIIGNDSFKELADYLFTSLKIPRWGIESHYEIIYNSMPYKICPFCGVEVMHKTFREDYDHLAPKKYYPLVSVHPRNLAPMCHTCNSKNKGEKDVLYNEDGTRKAFIYPYNNHLTIEFNYSMSIIPQTDPNNENGKWIIDINPDDINTRNWNSIFNIKTRYIKDYIEPCYETWLDDFITDCIEEKIILDSEQKIKDELGRLGKRYKRKWYEQTNIIKGPLFDFLQNCNNGIFYNSIISIYNRKIAKAA